MQDDGGSIRAFDGELEVPADKSISHRALMMASMAEGTSRLEHLLNSRDVRSTLDCVRELGAQVDVTRMDDMSFDALVTGWGRRGPRTPDIPLNCGNSGTTTRLLLGMLAGYDIEATLEGDSSLKRRPMRRVVKPLTQMGARFTKDGIPWDGEEVTLPLTVHGTSSLRAIEYDSPTASGQVKGSLLLAGLNAEGTTVLSEPYLSRNHTELMLPAFGAEVEANTLRYTVSIKGGQQLRACDVFVPGDPSSAMFIAVAAALVPGSDVTIHNLCLNPTRTAGLDVAMRMGCDIEMEETAVIGGEPIGDVRIWYAPALEGVHVQAAEIPALIDEIPVLALLATSAGDTTVFEGVQELRVKESNRLASVVSGLTALGCTAREVGDDLVIEGGVPEEDETLDPHGDHRLAMTWVLANRCFGLEGDVADTACIDVSYPSFIEQLDELQGL